MTPLSLKNIHVNNLSVKTLTLQAGVLHVFCGPSGSGKSTLAFDVIYAEADRLGRARGVQTVFRRSAKSGTITGLPPLVIGIEQQLTTRDRIESVAWHLGLVVAGKGQALCPLCKGKGHRRDIDPERLVRKPNAAPTGGAFSPAVKQAAGLNTAAWRKIIAGVRGVSATTPFAKLPADLRALLMEGREGVFMGLLPGLRALLETTPKGDLSQEMAYYMTTPPCPLCQAAGRIDTRTGRRASDPAQQLGALRWSAREREWLRRLGLETLALGAPLFQLSSSTVRKIRFFAALREITAPSLILFDEPAAGLTPAEASEMGALLADLSALGHTVIAVEHREEVAARADVITAFGPGSGAEGGRIVFQGSWQAFCAHQKNAPNHATQSAAPTKRTNSKRRHLSGVFRDWYGFKDLRVDMPLGQLVCVTGPSGSGKTALLDALYALCDKTPTAWQGRAQMHARKGQNEVRRPHKVDASPIGWSTASTPATYTALGDKIRALFAALPQAKKARLTASHFSFNTAAGRCPDCAGLGFSCADGVHYLPCPTCHAGRFAAASLKVRFQNLDIAQINALTIRQAAALFAKDRGLMRPLDCFVRVALDYLVLGQPSNTLSGGENLRVKLVKLLGAKLGSRSLYVMDNPCRGIGRTAIPLLAQALLDLTREHSVLVAENDPLFAAYADWTIQLGPPKNGKINILYQGPRAAD